jgi:hypothetical protein
VTQPYTWQASSTYLTSFVSATRALGHLDAVTTRLEAATRTMVAAPGAQAWWPGEGLVDLVLALEAVSGLEGVKAISIRGSRERMGPLVRPLAGVLLALSRAPALALLSRLGTFVSAGIKGIDARFLPNETKTGGQAVFTFPQPVPQVMGTLWHGLFDVGLTLAGAGRVVSETLEPTTHRFEVTW